ncbi:MAG: hypothetical protein HYS09_09715 [Chloroflexi bacterium]|nr:hypothetical protein [Chloroflexota bacterium]
MIAKRLRAGTERLLDPLGRHWRGVSEETLRLEPTPLGSQPSEYVRAAWEGRGHGRIRQVSVQAAHNGESLFFRLTWRDDTRNERIADTDQFPDACAVLFPLKGEAVLTSMGDPRQPVNAWYWRADWERPANVTATGLGTTVRHLDGSLRAGAHHDGSGWAVVIARPFAAAGAGELTADLSPGEAVMVGFAVWEGSAQERAGLKAVTLEWQPLSIEA